VGRGWGGSADQARDLRGDGDGFVERILVPDPDHTIAALLQPYLALRVTNGDGRMTVDAAVDLDDQARFVADEVDDVRTERGLAAKVRSIQIESAKRAPKPFLGGGGVRSQTRREALSALGGLDGA
jgi:hypothetical protein